MTWLDKLLMKIAVAKAAARQGDNPERTAAGLLKAFEKINEASADTSSSVDREEKK